MNTSWLDLLGAALGGGFAVKVLDYAYQEYRRRSEAQESAKEIIDKHIDPILKSADELVGKIRSLAQADFQEVIKTPLPKDLRFDTWITYLYILYLFAQFWSRIQILRSESLYVKLGADGRGKQLLDFFRTLESTKTRIVRRSRQRGMGEALLENTSDGLRTITYNEFVQRFLSQDEVRKWFEPLISTLTSIDDTRERQRLLKYGAIIHALIDTLDSSYLVTRKRPAWPNKLTSKSKRDLRFRVFRIYLPFVKEPERYLDSRRLKT